MLTSKQHCFPSKPDSGACHRVATSLHDQWREILGLRNAREAVADILIARDL